MSQPALTDSANKANQQAHEDFYRLRDSLHSQQARQPYRWGPTLDAYLADFEEAQRVERRQTYIRIGLGVAFVAVIVIGFARRRKNRSAAAEKNEKK